MSRFISARFDAQAESRSLRRKNWEYDTNGLQPLCSVVGSGAYTYSNLQ